MRRPIEVQEGALDNSKADKVTADKEELTQTVGLSFLTCRAMAMP